MTLAGPAGEALVEVADDLVTAIRFGATDSEHAFCALLSALQHDFRDPPPRDQLAAAIAAHAGRIGRGGTSNLLLGDGDQLYARWRPAGPGDPG